MDAKNIELSTVNPFFKQSSHLPPELQHYISNAEENIKTDEKKDKTRNSFIDKINKGIKCMTITFKKKVNVSIFIGIISIGWLVFFSLSVSNNDGYTNFISESPIAYMFTSFQFTIVLFMIINRYFEVTNIEKKKMHTFF